MNLIIDNQVFPCFSYMRKLITASNIKIEKYDNFKKMSFRNRYIISGANDLINLTIPVAGGREQKTLMKEIKIDKLENWQIKHWRSIVSSYSKSPFFEFYSEDVKRLIFNKEEFLFDFNMNVFEWLFKIFDINAASGFTEVYIAEHTDYKDFRDYFSPKSFQKNNIAGFPKYAQVFEDRVGFQPDLSILDLLFCTGPNAISLLNQPVNKQ